MQKETLDCGPQASLLPATQVKEPGEPQKAERRVSKELPQSETVTEVPVPARRYQRPGAETVWAAQTGASAESTVAQAVSPVRATPARRSWALATRSLATEVVTARVAALLVTLLQRLVAMQS